MNILNSLIFLVFGCSIGFGLMYLWKRNDKSKKAEKNKEKAERIIKEAKNEAEDLLLKAKTKAIKALEEIKREKDTQEKDIIRRSEHVEKKELMIERREENLEKEKKNLENKANKVKDIKKDLIEIKEKAQKKLESVAKLSKDEAKKELIKNFDEETKKDLKNRIRKIEDLSNESYEDKAKEIMTIAMQKVANSHSAEVTISNVTIPSDDLKGRIIGKDGRNIRKLEELTGVEILVDETPETIIISGFDPTRRFLAKLALDILIEDGRIHPARIEEVVLQAKQKLKQFIIKQGEEAVAELGIIDLNPKLYPFIGRLRFRTSFAQNALSHSMEVAKISANIAKELGANVSIARKAGLLHDIGKALDREVEGSHVDIGIRVLKKFNVDEKIIKAMQSHHEEYPYESLESRIVQVADAISASRVGARKDSLENYLVRLREIEDVANGFSGVDQSYAIQAGRELRVFVKPEKVDDLEAINLARKISQRIEKTLKYPGEIKVTLVRSMKVEEIAR